MLEAKECLITAHRCRKGIKEIRVERMEGNEEVFRYRRADRVTIADQPTLVDPYERKTVGLKVRKMDSYQSDSKLLAMHFHVCTSNLALNY